MLNVTPSLAAADKKLPAKPVAGKSVKRPTAKPFRPASAPAEIGTAEMIESTGLHGSASFYGSGFQGRKTSTGDRFDVRQFTAATNHFPLGSMLAVRRLDNDRCAIVKVNDRMQTHRRRVIDVSRGVAEYLDMVRAGVVLVRVAPLKPDWHAQGELACHSAFEPEVLCETCGQPPRLPDFPGAAGG